MSPPLPPSSFSKTPPHRCTSTSALALARQILGPTTQYTGGGVYEPAVHTERQFTVTMPDGSKKTIPAWMKQCRCIAKEMILQCPYTGELFAFRMVPALASRPHIGAQPIKNPKPVPVKVPPLQPAGASSGLSAGQTAAVAGGIVIGVPLLAAVVTSAVTGWGLGKVFDVAWHKVKAVF